MSKNIKRSSLVLVLILLFVPDNIFAKSFGPEEWTQYRMSTDNNAVFNNDSSPLDYQLYKTANEVRATPVIVGDKLFIGNHESGDLFAFDVKSGEKLWYNEAPNWIHSEMIYHDDMVYVGYGNRFFQDNGIRGDGDSGILALDADTGDIQWNYETDGEVMPTPAYYKDSVYITTGDRHLYKLDSKTGELMHKEEIGHTVSMSAPNIYKDTLFVGGSGPDPFTFSAFDLKRDEMKWQTEFPDVFAGLDDVPPAIQDNIIVTTALESDKDKPEHMIYAMDAQTGEVLWKDSLGMGDFVKNNKSGAPMIYHDKVYVGSPITESFYSYDLKTGEEIWKFENDVIKAPPAAQDGIVYFSNAEGNVYALDSETGEVLGDKELSGTLAPAGPVIINDTLFIGSQDSNVYAMPIENIVDKETLKKYNKSNTQNKLIYGSIFLVIIILVLGAGVLAAFKKMRHS